MSSQKHTDLIITSRLADRALHLQLCGEFYQKTTKKKKERKKGPNKGGKIKEQEIWQLITGENISSHTRKNNPTVG